MSDKSMHKEMIILDVLARKKAPISLRELQSNLNYIITPSTLRRLLKKLAERGEIVLIGQNKNRRYQCITPNLIEPKLSPHSNTNIKKIIFSEHSLKMAEQLKMPLYTREPCTYNELWLMDYIPNETFYLSKTERTLLNNNGNQKIDEEDARTYANKIFNRLLIDLSYNSSRLEGNTYSLIDTQKLLLEGKAAEDKLDADKIMILNHKEAIRFLVKSPCRVTITEDNIKTLHYLLSDGLVLPKDSGNFRNEEIKISGSTYIPIENYSRIEKIFSTIILKANDIKNVFEQSFFLLAHLSYLQAFIDVNKRTARLAANIGLINNNFIPVSFNYIEKEDYRMAIIAIYEYNDVKPLLDLFLFSYIKTCKEYQAISDAIVFDPQRIQYRQQRRNLIADIIRNKISKKEILPYIEKITQKTIPTETQKKFIEDTLDDLYHLNIIKLVGLGVSRQEFEIWQKLNQS